MVKRMGPPLGSTNAAKTRHWENALKRVIAQRNGGSLEIGLNRFAHKVVRMADGKGEAAKWALLEIVNRIDGKPRQAIVGDNEEPPIQVEGRIRLVRSE